MTYLVNHLVEASAAAKPHAVAVVDSERTLSYCELDTRSNQIANLLIDLGVGRGDRVAIHLDKSLESVAAIYGSLKAGAAYVPLDPQAPPARLAYMARNAGARTLLTGVEQAASWATPTDEALFDSVVIANTDRVETAWPRDLQVATAADTAGASSTPPESRANELDLAVILYTSGSTGTPKGVMLTHRNCMAFADWAAHAFDISPDDRVSSQAPFHFGASRFDLFGSARGGAAVVLFPSSTALFPSQLRRFVEEQAVTVWHSVPSLLIMLMQRGDLAQGAFPRLRRLLFVGEVFPTKHLRELMRLLPHVQFTNLYGSTETTTCTSWDVPRLTETSTAPIPIGHPIPILDAFALTDDGNLAMPGEIGELHVRGPTVMEGYVGDPERTAARLIPDPLGRFAQRVYRTGDLVEALENGGYRFVGRRDLQIKSRGYRIELGDVEAALYAHPSVLECVAVALPDPLVTNVVKVYVTSRAEISTRDLLAFCRERLPGYMVPDSIETCPALPKTSAGKVDRQALLARETSARRASADTRARAS